MSSGSKGHRPASCHPLQQLTALNAREKIFLALVMYPMMARSRVLSTLAPTPCVMTSLLNNFIKASTSSSFATQSFCLPNFRSKIDDGARMHTPEICINRCLRFRLSMHRTHIVGTLDHTASSGKFYESPFDILVFFFAQVLNALKSYRLHLEPVHEHCDLGTVPIHTMNGG